MTRMPKGPYVVWEDHGYEGWMPKSYETLKEAVSGERYTNEWIVTKVVPFEVNEVPT
jgi:hypothetical protein